MITILQFALWVFFALTLLLILTSVVIVVYIHFSFRRTLKLAAEIPCPKCGKLIGSAAIATARESFNQKIREMMEQHPGVKFRIVAEWEIDCPSCGSKFYFCPENRKVETVSISAKKSQGNRSE